MRDKDIVGPPLITGGLAVSAFDGEILVDAAGQSMPGLTARAARDTAKRLLLAAKALEAALEKPSGA